MYSEKVMDHFRSPRNYGKMDNPDGTGMVGNIVCGDVMHLYIKVGNRPEDGKEVIEDVKFETFGCVSAIASSSMVTDLAKGKTLEEAMETTNKSVADSLDGLPPEKVHCSVLAGDALAEAIYDYLDKSGKEIPEKLQKAHKRIAKEETEAAKKFVR